MKEIRKWWTWGKAHFHLELYLLGRAEHTMAEYRIRRSEHKFWVDLGIWGLFCLFFNCSHYKLFNFDVDVDDWDDDQREISFRIHHGSLWLTLWEDPDSWTRDSRQYSFNPMDFFFGSTVFHQEDLSDTVEVQLEMPEKIYTLTAKHERVWWTRPRLPFWKKTDERVELESEEGVPIPGKGESAWDLDDDAIFSSGQSATSISEAVDKFRHYIISRRERYGGVGWYPEQTA